jgi:hypothetical protein
MNYVELTDPDIAPNFTVYAKDAYSTAFKGSDLVNGVNGKPILVAYGQGNSQTDGLPLVDGNDQTDVRDGFDPEYGNAFGPVRLIVNDNTGWCVKWMTCIVIGTGAFEDPADYADDLSDIVVTVGKSGGGGNAPAAPSFSGDSYQVQPGDTLALIANKTLGSYSHWQRIYEMNRDLLSNPDIIYPGQSLRLPE